jgi:hypothetical protein
MFYYTCKRCNIMFKQKNDMRRHLEKKNICEIKNNDNNYTEQELYDLSFNKECEIKKNNKNNFCANCNKTFAQNCNYKRHIEKKVCLKKNKLDDNEKNNTFINDNSINIVNVDTINIDNSVNIDNSIINININMDKKELRGFDEDWDVSKINKSDILDILLNKHKFTTTLQNILKNEVNLNVIINNDNNGFIYKSVNKKYEPMKQDDIMQQSMDKIYKHLQSFYEEIIKNNINNYDTKHFDIINNDINKGYTQYLYENTQFKNIANNAIAYFYKLVKYEAEKKYNDIMREKYSY